MSAPADRLRFGECALCPYLDSGSSATCFPCAREVIPQIRRKESCELCDGLLNDGACGNPLCNRSDEARGWDFVWAIGRREGPLQTIINSYKYEGKYGWARILARLLVGFLDRLDHEYDAIIPMPTFVGEGGREVDHTALVLESARLERPDWPFRTDLIAKTQATETLVKAGNFHERALVAEHQIRPALTVLEPDWVFDKRVLVFDDVFTGGLTLREVAYKLKNAGAAEVSGIVLARQSF